MEPVRFQKACIAGCPQNYVEFVESGADCSYHWFWHSGDRPWCINTLRSNADFDITRAIEGKAAILFLNEPNVQEGCNRDCQLAFLHEYYPQVPDGVQVIFGNWAYMSRTGFRRMMARWAELYPGEPFPDVDIGVHAYAWVYSYDTSRWRSALEWYERTVREYLPDAQVIVTEFGSLCDYDLWFRVVGEQVPWMKERGTSFAVYSWLQDDAGLYCALWDTELTDCGRFYKERIQ